MGIRESLAAVVSRTIYISASECGVNGCEKVLAAGFLLFSFSYDSASSR